MRQWGAVGSAVGGTVWDGHCHALQGAADRGDLGVGHDRGGDEAGGEVGRDSGEGEGALLGRTTGGGGTGCSRIGTAAAAAAAGAALRLDAGHRIDQQAGVLRRSSAPLEGTSCCSHS